jgi:hypothetical protein
MSRSSAREDPLSRHGGGPGDAGGTTDVSSSRGQTSPLVALVAVAAVVAGVSLHAGVLAAETPATDRDVAEPTLDRVTDHVREGAVAEPARLASAPRPDGFRTNASLAAAGRRWTVGPVPPGDADAAERAVAVRLAPARVRTGRLRVEVWR